MERWRNKVAVVTGASSGIGAACSKALLDKGMIVVALARRFERMEKEIKRNLPKEQQNRYHPRKCDLTKEVDIVDTFKWIEETLGGIDVLINNAGIERETEIVAENNSADLRAVIDVNVLAVAFCTREAFRSMKKRGIDGHVIILNSVAGHGVPYTPGGSYNIYAPAKHALTAMNEVLRQEFIMHQTKTKVTSISPGHVDTEFFSDEFRELAKKENMPFLRPEDVADAIVYCIQTPPHVQIYELTIKPVGETC